MDNDIVLVKNPENEQEIDQFLQILEEYTNKPVGVVDGNQLSILHPGTLSQFGYIDSQKHFDDYSQLNEEGYMENIYGNENERNIQTHESNRSIQKNPLFLGLAKIDERNLTVHNTADNRTLRITVNKTTQKIGKIFGPGSIENLKISRENSPENSPGSISGRNIRTGPYFPNTNLNNSTLILGNVTNIYYNNPDSRNYQDLLKLLIKQNYVGQITQPEIYNLKSSVIGILGIVSTCAILYFLFSQYMSLAK